MSGGEGNPPSLKARFGVKGHTYTQGGLRYMRFHWHCDKHKKRLKAIRKATARQPEYK